MDYPRRGDIYVIDIPEGHRVGSEQKGKRFHLIMSIDRLNRVGRVLLVVPLTSPESKDTGRPKDDGPARQFRIRIPHSKKRWDEGKTGCSGDSIALTEQVFAMSPQRLRDPRTGQYVRRTAYVVDEALAAVELGLAYLLGIPTPTRAQPSRSLSPDVGSKRAPESTQPEHDGPPETAREDEPS